MVIDRNMLPGKLGVSRPRLGQISFLNTLPVVLPIERGQVPLDAQLLYGEPANMNRALDSGELDVASVSSFYYLQNENLSLVPGISISSCNEVGSVLLYSKVELNQLNGKIITVPQSSVTSVALLKVLFLENYGISPKLIPVPNPDSQSDANGDPIVASNAHAACIFGDHALKIDRVHHKNLQRHDLARLWKELTGLPMVFAVWAADKMWSRNNPQSFNEVSTALVQSVKLGLSDMFKEVLAEAHLRSSLPQQRLRDYYTNELSFALTPEHINGLATFKHLCHKHGLLPK